MKLKIVNVRTALLKAFKQDRGVFSKAMKELKVNSSFDFGQYTRCYPDNPRSATKGFFQMEIEQRHDNTYLFQIESVEGNIRNNNNYLDYYEIFEDEKALWFYVKDFFSKHDNLESLSQTVYRKFGFLRPQEGDLLLTQYNLLKEDLPDGDTFEDFLEDLDHFLKF